MTAGVGVPHRVRTRQGAVRLRLSRQMSPMGVLDRKAQIRSLGSLPLYMTNQGVVESGAAVSEQLATKGISSSELDLVLLSHLDCDHANGLRDVAAANLS